MPRPLQSVPDADEDADLSIGDLAERTGVAAATLRVWEARYGFPVPQRRASGHRRYTSRNVDLVREVVARRDGGVRLDVAIEHVLSGQETSADRRRSEGHSVFAQLRRTHPALMPHRLHKSTLLALSWAIEDEFVARADRAHLFGAFQKQQHYLAARARWRELSEAAASSFVYADFETSSNGHPHEVAVPVGSAMRREWSVVCDSETLPVALSAWELPGQHRTPDSRRLFEAIWTVDPTAVREASRVCAAAAAEYGAEGAAQIVEELTVPSTPMVVSDPGAVTSLFNRVIAYVDSPPPR